MAESNSLNAIPSKADLLHIGKNVPEPDLKFLCDQNMLEAKKNYWKERMGNIKKVVAPMVDQSELAFRQYMRAHNADLCFSPMIHAHLFITDATYRKVSLSTCKEEQEKPFIVQFCGNDPLTLLTASRYVEGYCSGVDLNLGCPQLIAKRGNYGAYLQEKRELIYEMVNKVYLHCKLPISVKIRVQNTVEDTIAYATMLENAGASMITIHGRTRDMRGPNTGVADWKHIAAVKKVLNIPLIANGNIQVPGDLERCLETTGADAVMSAEGILFNPLLFENSFEPCYVIAKDYLEYAKRYDGNISAVRAHIFRICHHTLIRHDDLRNRMSIITSFPDFEAIITELERRTGATEEDYKNGKKLFAEYTSHPSVSLKDFIEATPYWFSKPYIRPIIDSTKQCESQYRIQKRAEIQKQADATGLSKRQIRKKERRRIDVQRVRDAKQSFPPCKRCSQPASSSCYNSSCRKCCRLICMVEFLNCPVHKYVAEKLKPYRDAFLATQNGKEIETAGSTSVSS